MKWASARSSARAARVGLVDEQRAAETEARRARIRACMDYCRSTKWEGVSLELWLRRPGNSPDLLPAEVRLPHADDAEAWDAVATEITYAGHIDRMRASALRLQRQEHKRIPADLDYETIPALKTEARMRSMCPA